MISRYKIGIYLQVDVVRGYKDIEVEINKLLTEELLKLQVDTVELKTTGR